MSLLQHLDTLLSTFMYLKSQNMEWSEVAARKSSIKKVFLNILKFTGKHLRWGLFCNKAVGWRPATSLNTESGTGAFL